jgi:hypothetical protein
MANTSDIRGNFTSCSSIKHIGWKYNVISCRKDLLCDHPCTVAETSKQIGNLRARRSSDADSAEEADAAEPLRLRMRRVCTSVCGAHGCQINCQRMKREDLAILDAALGVYEDG